MMNVHHESFPGRGVRYEDKLYLAGPVVDISGMRLAVIDASATVDMSARTPPPVGMVPDRGHRRDLDGQLDDAQAEDFQWDPPHGDN